MRCVKNENPHFVEWWAKEKGGLSISRMFPRGFRSFEALEYVSGFDMDASTVGGLSSLIEKNTEAPVRCHTVRTLQNC